MEGVDGKQCTCRALCRESHDHFSEAPEKNYFYDVYEQKFWGAPVDQVTRALVGICDSGVCAASENSCQPLPTLAGLWNLMILAMVIMVITPFSECIYCARHRAKWLYELGYLVLTAKRSFLTPLYR